VQLDDVIENYLRTLFVRSWVVYRDSLNKRRPVDQTEMEKMMGSDREKGKWKFDDAIVKFLPSARRARTRRIKQRKGWVSRSMA